MVSRRNSSHLDLEKQADPSGHQPSVAFTETAQVPESSDRPHILCRASTTLDLAPARSPPQRGLYDHVPVLGWIVAAFQILANAFGSKKTVVGLERQVDHRFECNIPLEISLFLSSYFGSLQKRGLVDAHTFGALMGGLTSLNENITALERLLTTSLPFAYVFHLRFTVYLYLLIVPFQIVDQLGWHSIWAVTVAATYVFVSFAFNLVGSFEVRRFYLGFLEIGSEIENPFNYGKSSRSCVGDSS